MTLKVRIRTGLTGGAAGDVDGIDGSSLQDGEPIITNDADGLTYFHEANDFGTSQTEDSPHIIVPDTNPGDFGLVFKPAFGVFPGDIWGLTLSNDATSPDDDIVVAAGYCMDSTNTTMLAISSALTKQIDATFAAGDDAGGMFTGTVAADTWYHFFLIKKDSNGDIDAGFDTSITAANIPSGYTEYRHIGSVLTDGSSNILGFTQIGETFLWDDPILDVSETNVDHSSGSTKTLSVPTGYKVEALINVRVEDSVTLTAYLSSPDVDNEAPSSSAAPLATGTGVTGWGQKVGVLTNTSAQIRVRSGSSSVDSFYIATLGWKWDRGRNG